MLPLTLLVAAFRQGLKALLAINFLILVLKELPEVLFEMN